MSPQALRSFETVEEELSSFEAPVTSTSVLTFPASQSETVAAEAIEPPEQATEALTDAATNDGSPLIGLGFAVAIEAGTAFCLYGFWQLWHGLR
jgi:hypothetical protein